MNQPPLSDQFRGFAARYQAIQQAEQTIALEEAALYRRQLVEFAARHAKLPPVDPKPWTIPRIFSRGWHENFISDYLAYLLDPNKNGLGEQPLAAFLPLCDVDLSEIELADVTIYREYNLDGGRIDLFFEWEDLLVVGVEVKLGAKENPGQTTHYARVIGRDFAGYTRHCIFLTRGGADPHSPQFQPLTWTQVLEALRTVEITEVKHARQRMLWEDFLEHLEVFIVMTDTDGFQFSEKAQLYLEYRSMIEDVRRAFNAEYGDSIAFLENYLLENLGDGPWGTNFNKTRHHWHQVYKPDWVTQDLSIHYEYSMNPDSLSKGQFSFMVDVERPRAETFLSQFDQHYPRLADTYHKLGITYRPKSRKRAIAYKIYHTENSIEAMAQTFVDALEEFRFLEPEIEAVLSEIE